MTNAYLSAKDIQTKTGLSRPMVYQLLNRADCPALRIGRSIRVPENAFDAWMQREFGQLDEE